MAVGYDGSAFSFFAITILTVFLIPAVWYIVRTIRNWNPEIEAPVEVCPVLSSYFFVTFNSYLFVTLLFDLSGSLC